MIEKHPFEKFVPTNAKYLLLGSFPAKPVENYDWYYSNNRNQFWRIMEIVYNLELSKTKRKKELFNKLGIAITDIIISCEREMGSSMDNNLINITYNIGVNDILKNNDINKIFFTSRWVEDRFKKQFNKVSRDFSDKSLIYLPSPSPRFATMTIKQKAFAYRRSLPKLP